MTRVFPRWTRLALAVLIPVSLMALQAAVDAQTRGGSRGGGGRAAGGGGGSRAAGGGGGGQGAVGTAVPRGDRGGSGSGSAGKGATADNAAPKGDSGARTGSGARGDSGEGSTRSARPPRATARDGGTPVGRAVPRSATPPVSGTGGGSILVPGGYGRYSGYGGYGRRGYGGYYPWAFGGLGLGGYYGGYYDPYGGYYGAYGGYSGYPQSGYASGFEGKLRLKVKPRDAAVSIDGYYVGLVDDFDGVFQRLRIEAGMHRVEISAPGYEPLTIDVRIEWDQTVTYHGELKKLP